MPKDLARSCVPVKVDLAELDQAWSEYPVLVLTGFCGIDSQGRTARFGRGGSDLSALSNFLRWHLELFRHAREDG